MCTFENRNENEVASKFHKIRHSDIRPTTFTTLCIQFAFQKLPENRNKTQEYFYYFVHLDRNMRTNLLTAEKLIV